MIDRVQLTTLENEGLEKGFLSHEMFESFAYKSLSPEAKALLLLIYRKKARKGRITSLVDLKKRGDKQ